MEWQRIDNERDPDRCQGVDIHGQCQYKRAAPSNYCPRHGGNKGLEKAEKEKERNYHLGKWRHRVHQFADNPEIKSLREEIGIIRMMIESVLNRCEEEVDLITYSGKIQNLIAQAQKLVTECHRLEERTGILLDKQTILVLADILVKIIGEHVSDADALDMIAGKMVDVVGKMGGLQNVRDAANDAGPN